MPNNVVEPGECCGDGNRNNSDGNCNDGAVNIGGACACGEGQRACVQPPADMVAWYPMDDTRGHEVTGILLNDSNGTPGPGLLGYPNGPLPGPGKVGGALTFDGSTTFVRVLDAPNLNFGRGDFSIDAWVDVGSDAGAGVRPIVDKRDTGGVGGGVRGFEFFLFNGRLGFQLADAANSNNVCASSGAACTNYVAAGPSIADGNPHHVGVTVRRSGTPGLTLYVDGAAVFTVPNPRADDVDNGGDLIIGSSVLAGQFFDGWIDELEIFKRALDATEIAGIVKAGAAGKCRALDHFLCYQTQELPRAPRFRPIFGLRVADQFGASVVDVHEPDTLCTPTNKDDEDPTASAHPDHLRRYTVNPSASGTATVDPSLTQRVVNQFGTLFVAIQEPTALFVPTAKNLTGFPAAPPSPAIDHFLCHPITLPRGAPKFRPILRVRVEDQFGARLVDVLAPRRLCAPANKNGEDLSAPTHPDHLLCYDARLSKRVVQPADGVAREPRRVVQRFGRPISPVYTNNQLGPGAMAVVAPTELCVPSVKNPVDTGEEPPLSCDDGEFCTADSVVEYDPDIDDVQFENDPLCQGGPNDGQPCGPAGCGAGHPCVVPTYTPPKQKGCKHDWKTGPEFGNWLIDPNPPHANLTPCCEASSDCDDGNACTRDVCSESEHRCHFEPLDPQVCGTAPIPPVVPAPPIACANDESESHLCDIQCTPGVFGKDCPPARRHLELVGFADIHHHMFDEAAYGARWRHGKVSGNLLPCDGDGFGFPQHARVTTLAPLLADLNQCPLLSVLEPTLDAATDGLVAAAILTLGPPVISEFFGKIEGSQGDTGFHLQRRLPGTGWPRWDVMAHERGHESALKKAWKEGLRVIVVPMGGYEPFCELLPASNNYGCNEMDDVDRQIDLAQQFASANASWVQIALSPQDAVTITNGGKLAMVLAIETTDLFGSIFPPDSPNPPTAAAIDAEVQKYYDKGIRSVQLAHETDNGFSGAALIKPEFELFQFAKNKYGPSCRVDFDCSSRPRFGFDVYEDTDGVCKNSRGLTPAGEALMSSLMARGMLIDVAHLSEKGILRAYQLAKQNVYYPLFHSHTKFRELEPGFGGNNHNVIEHSVPAWVVQKIRRTGGMVGLRAGYLEERTYTPSGIANDCAGSSRTLAQAYEFGRLGLKVPMALGSDLNALTQTTRPRFRDRGLPGRPRQNPNGACAAGFKVEGICQTIAQAQKLGTVFDTLGLGDTGSEPDLLSDMANLGLGANISPLRDKSAGTFILMWLRAKNIPQRTGPADLANDIDVDGIEPYTPVATREQGYPGACLLGLKYCPDSEQLGDPCRFNAECVAPLTCGSGLLCGLPEGNCVCTKSGGCPATQYCKLGNPFVASDNVCLAKKSNGSFCLHNKECLSNRCKFKLTPGPPGPRCVP